MRVHFIAIGGAAMHNLAIALKVKKYHITGSDDIINDPSKSRLKSHELHPNELGWFHDRITNDIDAIVLGMHARADNPELLKYVTGLGEKLTQSIYTNNLKIKLE